MTVDPPNPPPRSGATSDPARELLASVSRSFYLSLRVLPRGMRQPVSLAYLLARLTDTVADSSRLAPARRWAWLGDLQAVLTGKTEFTPGAGWLTELQRELGPTVAHEGERELVARAGECLRRLGTMDPRDRDELQRVLGTIVTGQRLDVERFEGLEQVPAGDGGGGSGTDGLADGGPARLRARVMPDAQALHDYTFAVAGCVGRFWTRMCHLHVPRWHDPVADPGGLEDWGEQLGRGLQLVNLLRDAPKDLALGRCYLPLADAGGTHDQGGARLAAGIEWPLEQWLDRLGRVAPEWRQTCRDKLDFGASYVAATRHRRLRLAAALPWLLAERTLARLEAATPEQWQQGVKVPRTEVRSLLRRAGWRVVLGADLEPLRRA